MNAEKADKFLATDKHSGGKALFLILGTLGISNFRQFFICVHLRPINIL
jgi:hypothetical protein